MKLQRKINPTTVLEIDSDKRRIKQRRLRPAWRCASVRQYYCTRCGKPQTLHRDAYKRYPHNPTCDCGGTLRRKRL